jgi:Cof subfamily protein (haloacid dehalogenase superfamily)
LPPTSPGRRFRILALDVDGTLLDRSGHLRPATIRAVARAAEAGIRPVLCTGRRYRRALPIARELGLDAPLVCNSGALVKSSSDHRTLWRADIDPGLVAELLDLYGRRDEVVVSFTDHPPDGPDFLVDRDPTGRPLVDDYLVQNRPHAAVDPRWGDDPGRSGPHYHLCVIGDRDAMLDAQRAVEDRFVGRFTTFVQRSPHYRGTMCETLRHDASKWSALLHLAELWGVGREEIVAVGDDMNDVPMIAGAGLGVAMGHAPEAVRSVADHVTHDEENDGLARFVEEFLLA